jgi:glycosyltransferase involved in cell wall biosynthesis
MKKKKILISSTTFNRKIKDGIFYYTKSLSENFSKIYNIKKVAFEKKYNFWTQYPYSFYAILNQLTKIDFKLKSNIDLIHITDHRFLYSKLTPIISTIHDIIPLEHPEWEKSILRKTFYKKIFLKGVEYSDQIITVSNHSANKLNLLGVKSNKINVVYNAPKKNFLENNLSIKKEKYLLFIGTISPRKNLLRVLKAVTLLDKDIFENYKLIIIGKISFILPEESLLLKKLIKINKVVLLKNISDKHLLEYYKKSELLIFPSLSEGFGYPILEAFATKLPVITSKYGATKEIANDAALLINPFNVLEIKDSIMEIIKNNSLKNNLIKKGTKRLSFFSHKKLIKETDKVYKKTIL